KRDGAMVQRVVVFKLARRIVLQTLGEPAPVATCLLPLLRISARPFFEEQPLFEEHVQVIAVFLVELAQQAASLVVLPLFSEVSGPREFHPRKNRSGVRTELFLELLIVHEPIEDFLRLLGFIETKQGLAGKPQG